MGCCQPEDRVPAHVTENLLEEGDRIILGVVFILKEGLSVVSISKRQLLLKAGLVAGCGGANHEIS